MRPWACFCPTVPSKAHLPPPPPPSSQNPGESGGRESLGRRSHTHDSSGSGFTPEIAGEGTGNEKERSETYTPTPQKLASDSRG